MENNYCRIKIADKVAALLHTNSEEIYDVQTLKKGMTNRSFLFRFRGKRYVIRIPGEGTEKLIDRKGEYEIYKAIRDLEIADHVIYEDAENGYKITEFYENARTCNAFNDEDVQKCMKRLRNFHGRKLRVGHSFLLWEQINFYEVLWMGRKSQYEDYETVKSGIHTLIQYVEGLEKDWCLCHIDSVPDNFLFVDCGGSEQIRLIDWEYAGMQDPHLDIAMFAIYAGYKKDRIDWLITTYFEGNCSEKIRTKIYCYVAIGGLLWSNWCEYKKSHGVEFGEYSQIQYQYARDFFDIAAERIDGLKNGI